MAAEQITYKNIDPKVRKMIMFGLTFAMLIACFDGTIVGTCGPVIASDLNGSDLYAWMITAYMLCETLMIPISGKLSDLYGRKPLFLIGLSLFVLGSLVAGLSTNMEMFIACRAVQGLGGGILIPVATASVADLYSPEDRAKMQGLLGAVFGIGSGVGPLLGGYITEYISWHWIFYINIPLAIVSFLLTIKKFPMPVIDEKPSVDVKGIIFLSLLLTDVLLFFEWAGDKFEWASVESIAMIAAAVILLLIFLRIEKSAKEPILAPHLIKNRTVVMAALFMFIFGIAMMGAMMYASMFGIVVFGFTTLEAGKYSLAMVFGMMITALTSGALVNKTGYKPWLISGPVITFASLMLMSRLTVDSEVWYMIMCLFVFGFGLGCMMSVIMTAVQNSSDESEMGMTTSSVNLIRSIGSTIGTAVFAMIINNKLASELQEVLPPMIYDIVPHDTGIIDALMTMPEIAYLYGKDIIVSFANSVDFSFFCGGMIMLILVVIGIFFKARTPAEVAAENKEE